MLGKKYSYYVNDKRFHGFDLSLDKLKGYLIISSDFAITRSEVENIVNNDIVLLSTDHHECQNEFIDEVSGNCEGIVINNQYPFEPEEDRYLSGAGVFYELICSLYPDFKSSEREALVGITLLTDIREIENQKARKYLRKTYTANTECGYANYLVTNVIGSDFGFGLPKLDRNFIDYNLSPYINSLLRFNKKDQAVNFILGKGIEGKGYQEIQKELVDTMLLRAQILNMPNISILAINSLSFTDYEGISITNFIGLLCSKYKDTHGNKSTLGFVYENGKILRASFRGKYSDIHYRVGFKNLGIKAEGHPSAFGIVDFFPTEETWTQLNDLIYDLEYTHSSTITIVKTTNLAIEITNNGMKYASENCYCRDMYRTYIKYLGKNYSIIKTTYKTVEFTTEDYKKVIAPDKESGGTCYKYLRDNEGNPIPKYIEYLVDGRTVKSFGVSIEEGFILPILEKGYITLYLHSLIV